MWHLDEVQLELAIHRHMAILEGDFLKDPHTLMIYNLQGNNIHIKKGTDFGWPNVHMICIPKFGGGGGRNNIGGASTELEDSGYEAEGASMGESFDPVAKDYKKKKKVFDSF